jgi:hypothetical protein
MTNEEEHALMALVMDSREFQCSLETCEEGIKKVETDLSVIALWFFTRGYVYCLDKIKECNE